MTKTTQSEYAKIDTLFLKKVGDAFIGDAEIEAQWQVLNYLSKPDFSKAVREYAGFENIFQEAGIKLKYFPEDPSTGMDSVYCRDAAICTDEGMILCAMGKEARVPEPAAQEKAFRSAGISILGKITFPGTVEGGDTAWLDAQTLAVGHSYRTNPEGIRQLTEILTRIGVSVIVADLPHYKGPSDVFHLMSVLSPVDKDLAVVYSPLLPIAFRKELLARGYAFVEVPEAEFDSMGCNVLALAPRKCLMVNGNPITRGRLEDAGCSVQEYEGSEISVKGGGGPTCLTRPVWRSV